MSEPTVLTDRLEAHNYRPADVVQRDCCACCAHVEIAGFDKMARCLLHDAFVGRDNVCDSYRPATCDTCLWGRGRRYRGGPETDDFCCDQGRVPFDQRVKVEPETLACQEYLPVQTGYTARLKNRENYERDMAEERHCGGLTFGVHDLNERQRRNDAEEGRQHDKGIGQPGSFKYLRR